MLPSQPKSLLKFVLTLAAMLLGGSVSFAQRVDLTAGPNSITLPDGTVVPMWGYACTGQNGSATCAASNANAGGQWSPVLITVPPGSLTIRLTNALPTPPGATTGIPTSLMIVGQLGGGLGIDRPTTPSPNHATQSTTWPIAGDTSGPQFTPPSQLDRVRSMATEVATTGTGTATSLKWTNLKPGTYLIESATHPSIQVPMGLYGVLVVTTAPLGATPGTAYPAAGS